jgi:hypothetical protein
MAVASNPLQVTWSQHAFAKATILGVSRADVEQAVLEGHPRRLRNSGDADWRILVGRWVVLYNHPDREDPLSAHIVTLWRQG